MDRIFLQKHYFPALRNLILKENPFLPVSVLLPSGSLHRRPKNNIDNWGKGKFLVLATIFVRVVALQFG